MIWNNTKSLKILRKNISLCNSGFIHKKHTAIIESFGTLLSTKLPPRTMEEAPIVDTSMNFSMQKLITAQSVLSKTKQNAEMTDDIKKVIDLFAKKNKIVTDGDFWNVGDLKKIQPLHMGPFGGGPTFEGTDDEKDRYDALIKLYWDIAEYNEYITYFTSFDVKKRVRLVLSNSGNTFDEDIDIKMIIPAGFICHAVDFSYPGANIINDINKMNFLKSFKIEENKNIQPYDYYPVELLDFSDTILKANPFNSPSDTEKYEKEKRKYDTAFENIFYYKPFDGADNDILTFHIDYLKHHTVMAFPSVLLFNKVPPYIEYEIRSKRLPENVKGKLEFQEDH